MPQINLQDENLITHEDKFMEFTKQQMLFECAWEVCNQVGGIYTVIRSKVPSVMDKWGKGHYCLLGPYIQDQVAAVFDPIEERSSPTGKAVKRMIEMGFDVHYGHWLVSGRPRVVLFNPNSIMHRLGEIQYELWDHHHLSTPSEELLMKQVITFGFQVKEFFKILCSIDGIMDHIVAHFHEWMAGTPIPEIRRLNLPIKIIFTTHATLLGRYLAMNDPMFYGNLPFYDWAKESIHFNIKAQVDIERAATHGSHVFTTVSDVTGRECEYLLGRVPDKILPNGLNISRFEASHEFQNLHVKYKEMIHEFVMGHFFPSYSFDLKNTIYFFTSGRYEYQNKGFDLTLEALARLNWKMKISGSEKTVVMFFITKKPCHSMNAEVLHTRGIMDEIQKNCEEIKNQIGKKLFYSITSGQSTKMPDLNGLVDDYNRLRLRRTVQSWKTGKFPTVITHNLIDDNKDEILSFLRVSGLINGPHERVKIIYHPDFISPANPLFKMEYGQFVRGCHLGVFPSYYEPWGYTPLESIASGIPAITSDLAGFGDYVKRSVENPESKGIYVVERRYKHPNESADQLANMMFDFVEKDMRSRIAIRNNVEASSQDFDWTELGFHYDEAYMMAAVR